MKNGDKITVVDRLLNVGGVIHAEVLGPTFLNPETGRQRFQWHCAGLTGWTSTDEEGQVWIHGHHNDQTAEGRALMVARALS